jgi:hypothetical protein
VKHGHQKEMDEVQRVAGARRDHVGVLRGRPPLDPMARSAVGPVNVRRVDEVRRLLGLLDRGLLSEEEFESQLQKAYRAQRII